jgi:hypothetical protein
VTEKVLSITSMDIKNARDAGLLTMIGNEIDEAYIRAAS